VVALLSAYNEEQFAAGCIEHLIGEGLAVYVVDDGSTDATGEIVRSYLGSGVIGLERRERGEHVELEALLQRKEELAMTLYADWFLSCDFDEIRTSPWPGVTLREAVARVDGEGYNAVNFQEFTFVPTREERNHDHPRFRETMRSYYPFAPFFPHRLMLWKKQEERVDLVWSGGHKVRFPGLRLYPQSFIMKHYLFLSPEHAQRKYGWRVHPEAALARGWHGWREGYSADTLDLPYASELRLYVDDSHLDASSPWKEHCLAPGWRSRRERDSE
jgi:glycosyltransferase involved in cell wall biosynthesis